ncbi:hypothetical protein [Nocardioides sp. BYT-33-1]|uniref:hypothetical protein n=1 Tax=Nocardioides sp. BYT-33-1 TaxID=3416952 RepID=UPI003F52A7DD
MSRTWHAWVDESVSVGGDAPGFYVLAASVADPGGAEAMRSALRELVPKPRRRLHWHSEEAATRREVIERIAELNAIHVVVVRDLPDARRQERARRLCLERLLFELDQLEVARVWLESRGSVADGRDQLMVAALRGSGAVSAALRVGLARPLDEPMLWLPDAVAGVVRHSRRTGDRGSLLRWGSSVAILD